MMLAEELKLKAKKYEELTEKAISLVEIAAEKGSKESETALDFLEMARSYLSDGKYYAQKGDLLTALASFSYAHAWVDAGVRSGILKGEGHELFVQPKKGKENS